MARYNSSNVNLSNSQSTKVKLGIKILNMTNFPDKLLLTDMEV